MPYSLQNRRIWVAGHRGLVGSALVRRLEREKCEILTVDRSHCDLRTRPDVDRWIAKSRPDAIILAAATVGGIHANDTRPAEFIYDNLMIETNVIDAARQFAVEKLVFLGSSCIYPRDAAQPISEDALLTGPLEPTNQWYATAKIAGVKLCQAYRRQYGCDFVAAMPTNLYGPGDNFDLLSSHVVPALIAKTHQAQKDGAATLKVWGTGRSMREFLHVDDAADGIVFVLKNYSNEAVINIGTGSEISIANLARLIGQVIGFQGEMEFDASKPDGTPRKIVDTSRLTRMGWQSRISLAEGLADTWQWYLKNLASTDARGGPRAIAALS
jgi:GDP-L-fucose synthase